MICAILRGDVEPILTSQSVVDDVSGATSPILVPHVIREFHRQVSVRQRSHHRPAVAAAGAAETRYGGLAVVWIIDCVAAAIETDRGRRFEMCEFTLRHPAP
jgi:hypothetical protein